MKATDLMIGDWVRINYRNKVVQVTEIVDKAIGTTAISPLSEDEFEPIPLTKEILIKNGWREDSDYETDLYGGYFPEDEKLCLELDVNGGEVWWTINSVEYYIIQLHYVHELQHALKLCGIDKEIIL